MELVLIKFKGSGDDIVVSEFGEDSIWLDEGNDTVYVFCNGNSTWLNDYNVLDDALYIVGSNFSQSSEVITNAFREYSNYGQLTWVTRQNFW